MKAEGKATNGKWPEVSFGEIFAISSSKRVLEAQWKTAGVPFYRAREIVKLARVGAVQNELFISEELYREYQAKYGVPKPGDLMISAVGTLGACYVVQPSDRFYYKDASVLRFSPKQPVCSRFIQHAFGTNHILDQVHAGSGSTVGTYTISRANETRIPLPPLAEQRRIAEVLDRAEALRAKRRAALAQLDSLTQSLFLDLFFDPVLNERRFPTKRLIELVDQDRGISYGVVQRGNDVEDGVPVVRITDVVGGEIVPEALKRTSAEIAGKYRRTVLRGGEIVISIRGTIGRCALVPKQLWGGNITRELALIPHRNLNSLFLLALLRSDAVQRLISGDVKGIAQRGINLEDLRELPVILPPDSEVGEFARRVTAVEALKRAQRASLAELDALFATLQHRAFRGEL